MRFFHGSNDEIQVYSIWAGQDANSTHDAYDEQQHLKNLFAGVISQCDTELGALGSLNISVLDPLNL